MDKAEWTQIASNPDHVWPLGWHTATGPEGSTVLVRQESAAGEGNGEDNAIVPSIPPKESDTAERPRE